MSGCHSGRCGGSKCVPQPQVSLRGLADATDGVIEVDYPSGGAMSRDDYERVMQEPPDFDDDRPSTDL